MADRIERYLGRLEAELEGRIPAERVESVILEVESHLRESEDAWQELGEPADLANRLAVENFGGVAELSAQLELGNSFPASWPGFWGGFNALAGFSLVAAFTVLSVLTPRIDLFSFVVFVAMFLVMLGAAALGKPGVKKCVGGMLAAACCVLVCFGVFGRGTFSEGLPVVGLNIGRGQVLYHGSAHLESIEQMRLDQLRQTLREGERHQHIALYGPSFEMELARREDAKGGMLIEEGVPGWTFSRSSDYAAIRRSWRRQGEQLLMLMRENVAAGERSANLANGMLQPKLAARGGALLVGFLLVVGGAAVAVGLSASLGLWIRRAVGFIASRAKNKVRRGV